MFRISETRSAQIAEKPTVIIDTKLYSEYFPKVILKQQEKLQFPIKGCTQ